MAYNDKIITKVRRYRYRTGYLQNFKIGLVPNKLKLLKKLLIHVN